MKSEFIRDKRKNQISKKKKKSQKSEEMSKDGLVFTSTTPTEQSNLQQLKGKRLVKKPIVVTR